jgi:hypothetical protein
MKEAATLLILLLFFLCPLARAEEYKFEPSEIEKKPYHLGGFGEFRPVLNVLDKSAALYKVNFYNQNVGDTTKEYNFRLQLEGSYEEGIARLFMRMNQDVNNTYQGWSSDGTLYEGFLSLKPSNSWVIDIGKRTFKWGKGYAWNPVAFIDRPKDPTDPELALEGFWAGSIDYIRSFEGPLKTFSFTPVLLPVINDEINGDIAGPQLNLPGTKPPSASNQINMAGRFYFLLYDTDIDLIFFTGGSKTTRYGVDFSRNISTSLEVHGELALIEDFQKTFIDQNGNLQTSNYDHVWSYLLGIRYLSPKLTTYILEYYRNEAGFTKNEVQDFFSFVNKGYSTYLSTGNAALIQKASALTQGNFGKSTPMQDYLYLRLSQQEPFDILYFTPAITSVVNLNDQSFQLIPELLYTGITNLELRFRTYFLVGKGNSEFGEKPNDYRIEIRARYYF